MGLIRGSEGAGGVDAPLRKSIRGMIDAISKEACPGSAPARFTGSRAGTTARVSAKNNPAAASRVSAIAPPEDRYWGGGVFSRLTGSWTEIPGSIWLTGYIPKMDLFQ